MSKHPCGECTIGVRYQGILCTGPCNLWFHTRCLGWTDKKLKKLTNTETAQWKCNRCSHGKNSTISDQELQIIDQTSELQLLSKKGKSHIEEIQEKVQHFEKMPENDLETSLNLAAEVGSALLEENSQLKQEIENLRKTNFELLQLISNQGNNCLKPSYEAKIEQLEQENQETLNRYTDLIEKYHEIEKKLEKETLLRKKVENSFEEHDIEKEQIILGYEDIIKKLKTELNGLRKKTAYNPELANKTKTFQNIETQTCNPEPIIQQKSIPQPEILLMESRQSQLEHSISILQKQIQSILSCNKKQEILAIEKESESSTPLCPLSDIKNRQNLNTNKDKKPKMKKNYFSMSLRNAKFRADSDRKIPETLTHPISKPIQNPPKTSISPHYNKFKVTFAPPITAIKREPSESIQDFYDRHIKNVQPQLRNHSKNIFLGIDTSKTVQS